MLIKKLLLTAIVFKKIKKYKEEIIGVVSGATRAAIYTTAYIAKKLKLNGLNHV
jgi:hypothetical protein